MAKAIKTNVLRHLDAAKIPYETREYDVSDENYDGKLVSAKVGLPAEMIYKTLVLTGDKSPVGSKSQYLVCVIPVEMELNLKAVARATGNKAVAMLHQKDLLPLTGYLRGGCSPIGMKKLFPTYIQADAQELERISVSAGVRGCQVILAVDALAGCTKAKFAELCRE
ncbi:MAG: Cys-tRNA(Pro) deacylase [Clostridia bacterium]|nr:Cys-tRNA(Pro) deacylase [Clostridia bacterium]